MRSSQLWGNAWVHLRRRRTRAWGAVLAVGGTVLCLVPLFNLLGYEFSLAMAVLGSLAAAHLGAVHGRASGEPGVWHTFASACVSHVLLLLPPLLLISLNAFRIRNCNYLEGLAFYALLPGISVACATAAGVCAGALVRRPWLGTASALALVLGSWALAALRFYAEPPVHAFDPFFGYLPGALYDEDVAVTPALLWYRAMNLTLTAAGLLLLSQRPVRALLALTAGIVIYAQGPRLGFRGSAEDIAAALGGRYETDHLVILYRDDGRPRDLAAIGRDHEFRFAQLSLAMGVQPSRKVRVYLFPSAAQKRRLLGAGQTFVAKPWRGEIYLQEGEPPQEALRHELAHVFGAEWAPGVLGIPPTFDLGLVEGLAVALDWPSDEGLDPHAQAKLLRNARMLPPITAVLGSGFLRHPPARAYVVAGSFIRYLLDRYGRDSLRRAYATGDLSRAYGRPLAALEEEWHAMLDAVVLDPIDRAALEERFRRPSIWHRTCAHEIATLSQEADALASRPSRAAEVLRRIADLDPGEPSHLLELGDALARAGRPADARATLARLLAHVATSASLRQRAHGELGDLAWSLDHLDDAATAYGLAAGEPGSEAERRLLALKRFALDTDPDTRATLRDFLLPVPGERRDAFVDGILLARLSTQMPGAGLPGYLLGRQLLQRGRFREAVAALRPACGSPLPGVDFARECWRLLATAAWRHGDLEGAVSALRDLRAARREGGDTSFATDMQERLDWERRGHRTPSSRP